MYIPKPFAEADQDRISSLIHDNAFGVLTSVVDGRIQATHIPFLYDQDNARLLGHLARENAHWQSLVSAPEVLVVFNGPHAYVSPTWYAGAGVPTWNYASVHVYGKADVFHDSGRLHDLVGALSRKYEANSEVPWSGEYDREMLKGIVGLEIEVKEIQAKFKLSQNRPVEDRKMVADMLSREGASEAQRVAAMMLHR